MYSRVLLSIKLRNLKFLDYNLDIAEAHIKMLYIKYVCKKERYIYIYIELLV